MATDLHTQFILSRVARSVSLRVVAPLGAAAGLCWALCLGHESSRVPSTALAELATVEVDQGDVVPVVTEQGSIESPDDSLVRCRVESFLGLPVGRRLRTRSASWLSR